MKELVGKYLHGSCSPDEVELLLEYFGFQEREDAFGKAVLFCLSTQDHRASLPVAERIYEQLKEGNWQSESRVTHHPEHTKWFGTEYVAAGVLICLFIVLMFFLFRDKIQYDKTWKTEPATVAMQGL